MSAVFRGIGVSLDVVMSPVAGQEGWINAFDGGEVGRVRRAVDIAQLHLSCEPHYLI